MGDALPVLLDVPAVALPPQRSGVFTGALFRKSRPDDYARIVELRAQGLSVRAIADQIAGISTNTVLAVLRAEREAISERKTELANACLDVATLAGEEIHRRLEHMPGAIDTSDLVKIHNSAIEKGLLLAGEATQRVENVSKLEQVDAHALMTDYLTRLPSCATPETGRSVEKDAAEKTGANDQFPADASVIEVNPVVEVPQAATDLDESKGGSVDSESDGKEAKTP